MLDSVLIVFFFGKFIRDESSRYPCPLLNLFQNFFLVNSHEDRYYHLLFLQDLSFPFFLIQNKGDS